MEQLTVRLRECWIKASNLHESAAKPGWTPEPTLHALAVEYVFVPQVLRRKGLCRSFLSMLADRQDEFELVVVEGVSNPDLFAALQRWGWPHDPKTKDFYYAKSEEADRAVAAFVPAPPRPRVTDTERVVDALLLTDAGHRADAPCGPCDIGLVERAVAGWTDDQKAAAFEWAACAHLAAGDNDVEVPDCPPHVEAIRPKYGK